MSISAPFIKRPIGTSLLTLALLMSGVLAFTRLPVALIESHLARSQHDSNPDLTGVRLSKGLPEFIN